MLFSASLAAQADDVQDATKLFKQGQHSQALSKVNSYLASKPKDAQARFLKGLIFTEQAKTVDAINIFSALSADYPELPEPYNNLAVLYASQGQYDNAKLALEMAIRTHPSYATAHENLGDIYAKMASQAYDRALQLDRSNTATQTKLSMIQELFAADPRSKEAATPTTGKRVAASPAITASPVTATKPAIPASPSITTSPVMTTSPAITASPVTAAAHKPAPTQTSSAAALPAPVTDNNSEIIKTVNAWAAAWSSQNANNYLSFYADDFITPSGETRAVWEAIRKERINTPKSIQVDISNAAVVFGDDNHATVKFRQSYRANHLKTSGKKTLLMAKTNGKWLIREERSK